MKIELGYKTIVISISAMLGILSSSTTLSGTIENIALQGVSLGDDIESTEGKLKAIFPDFGRGNFRCTEPDKNWVSQYKNMTPSEIAEHKAEVRCTGKKTDGKGGVKTIEISYNGNTNKIYYIAYHQRAHVASDYDGCEKVIQEQMASMNDKYGNQVMPMRDRGNWENNDVSYDVMFECKTVGDILKREYLKSKKLADERPSLPKSSLD